MTSLTDYRLLGRSGLRVSPLALGAMAFGQDWGWGSAADEARRMFDLYVDRGGNFIDTAVNSPTAPPSAFSANFSRTSANGSSYRPSSRWPAIRAIPIPAATTGST